MGSVFVPLVSGVFLPVLLSVSGGSLGPGRRLSENVDLIELNHFYDDLGRHQYDQVIFYEWSPDYSRFHVVAWCLIEDDHAKLPVQEPGSGKYVVRWYDRESKVTREVRSKLYRETWSCTDPERANKKLIEEKYRVSLLKVTDQRLR